MAGKLQTPKRVFVWFEEGNPWPGKITREERLAKEWVRAGGVVLEYRLAGAVAARAKRATKKVAKKRR